MAYLAEGAACPLERIHRISDPASGLEGVIVVHSTRLGTAAGFIAAGVPARSFELVL